MLSEDNQLPDLVSLRLAFLSNSAGGGAAWERALFGKMKLNKSSILCRIKIDEFSGRFESKTGSSLSFCGKSFMMMISPLL